MPIRNSKRTQRTISTKNSRSTLSSRHSVPVQASYLSHKVPAYIPSVPSHRLPDKHMPPASHIHPLKRSPPPRQRAYSLPRRTYITTAPTHTRSRHRHHIHTAWQDITVAGSISPRLRRTRSRLHRRLMGTGTGTVTRCRRAMRTRYRTRRHSSTSISYPRLCPRIIIPGACMRC